MDTLTAELFQSSLDQFIGSEQWYAHSIEQDMLYTDGVQYFAAFTDSYWLLDIIAKEFFPLLTEQTFLVIKIESDSENCQIIVTDGNHQLLKSKVIPATQLVTGTWQFYLTDNVLLLPSEY